LLNAIAIIPARGGSKRIPRKNIKHFHGKPIIAYSIEAALGSQAFDEVMVSTDDTEIAEVAKKYGASVPFLRSATTSTDMAMTVPVLLEVLDEYTRQGQNYDFGCCLYPCAPFITPNRLRDCMKLFLDSGADSALPVARFSYPPQRCLVVRGGKAAMLHPENYNVRSQDLEPLYHDAGQFYCFRTASLRRERKLYCANTVPIVLLDTEVQDIDTEDDWLVAEVKYRILKETGLGSV